YNKTKPMQTINKLTLAAVAATLLFATSIARADDNGAATINFTKWRTELPPLPGAVADMAGIIVGGDGGGDVGDGQFTGEVLSNVAGGPGVRLIEAVYHLNGSKHSFTVRVHVVQIGSGPGAHAALTGFVTDGWLKGHAVEGVYTVIRCEHDGVTSNCFEVTLDIIKRHSND